MGIEEAALNIVGVLVGVAVAVVDAMVSNPVIDGPLMGSRVAEHEKNTNRERGCVRPMRPETMGTCSNASHAYTLGK